MNMTRIRCRVISGKDVPESIITQVKIHTDALVTRGIRPGLAVVFVGSDPASQVYVSSKGRKAEECGILSIRHELPEHIAETELLELIVSLNRDTSINGIRIQLPFVVP